MLLFCPSIKDQWRTTFNHQTELKYLDHGGLTGKPTKCVQYGINDLFLYRPGFYAPDTSGSSRTVHKFVQVVTYRNLAK